MTRDTVRVRLSFRNATRVSGSNAGGVDDLLGMEVLVLANFDQFTGVEHIILGLRLTWLLERDISYLILTEVPLRSLGLDNPAEKNYHPNEAHEVKYKQYHNFEKLLS